MQKTIIVEFPDEFEFPNYSKTTDMQTTCMKCPLFIEDDWFGFCAVTDSADAPCPFFHGEKQAFWSKK